MTLKAFRRFSFDSLNGTMSLDLPDMDDEDVDASSSTSIGNVQEEKRTQKVDNKTRTENLATIMKTISEAGMHISSPDREYLIRRFSEILCEENYDEDCPLVNTESLKSLLNLLSYKHSLKEFGITLAPDGNLLGSWYTDADNLHILFLGNMNYMAACNRSDIFGGEDTLINQGNYFSLHNYLNKHSIKIEN